MILTPVAFTIFCFFGVWFYGATDYLTPIPEFYEGFAMIAAFYLLIDHVTAATHGSPLDFLYNMDGRERSAMAKTCVFVMQILPVRLILLLVSVIIDSTECFGTKKYNRTHTVVSIVQGISTALCIISIIKFYLRHRVQIHASDPSMMWKLVPFKGLIGVQALQRIVLNAMNQANALNPTRTLSYNDLNIGLNPILTCLEAFLFMLFYIVPYFPRRSRLGAAPSKRMRFFPAMLHALNLLDVIRGIFTAIRLFQVTKPGRDMSRQQNGWAGNKISPTQYGGPQQQEYNDQYRQ